MEILSVALGGALGAVLRYGVGLWTMARWGANFPWGTFSVNLLGSFVIGFLWQWFERFGIGPSTRVFIFVGMLGAFTTFSSFTLDALQLFRMGRVGTGLLYLFGSNGLGLTAVFLGVFVAQQILKLLRA